MTHAQPLSPARFCLARRSTHPHVAAIPCRALPGRYPGSAVSPAREGGLRGRQALSCGFSRPRPLARAPSPAPLSPADKPRQLPPNPPRLPPPPRRLFTARLYSLQGRSMRHRREPDSERAPNRVPHMHFLPSFVGARRCALRPPRRGGVVREEPITRAYQEGAAPHALIATFAPRIEISRMPPPQKRGTKWNISLASASKHGT
jgi:hypothetical protein